MTIVTVKTKYQVVIPQTVRKQLGINRGDRLEAKVERGKLTYNRKAVIDRRVPTSKAGRERFFKQLQAESPDWLKEMWAASKRAGLDKTTMGDINAEIGAYRREKSAKKTGKQPAK